MGEKNRRGATVCTGHEPGGLLDFGFAVGDMFAGDGIELFGFELLGFGALIFGHGVKMTGTGGGNEFNEVAGHERIS